MKFSLRVSSSSRDEGRICAGRVEWHKNCSFLYIYEGSNAGIEERARETLSLNNSDFL